MKIEKHLGELCLIVRIRWTPFSGVLQRQKIRLNRPGKGLLLGVLMVAPGLPVSTSADVPPALAIVKPMKRAPEETLTLFMKQNNFARPYHVAEILEAAEKASIPPSLIACIELYESSGGKHYDVRTNNPLGWNNGSTVFSSVPAAIHHVSSELGFGRGYAGKTVPEKLHIYNPRPQYSIKILGCMKRFPK